VSVTVGEFKVGFLYIEKPADTADDMGGRYTELRLFAVRVDKAVFDAVIGIIFVAVTLPAWAWQW